jgi:hypothetical protein
VGFWREDASAEPEALREEAAESARCSGGYCGGCAGRAGQEMTW